MRPQSTGYSHTNTRVLQSRDTNSLKRPQSKVVSPFPKEEPKRVKIGKVSKSFNEKYDHCMAEHVTADASHTILRVCNQNTDKSVEEALDLIKKFAECLKSAQAYCKSQSVQWNMNEEQLVGLMNSAFGPESWSGDWIIGSDTSEMVVGYNSCMDFATLRVQFTGEYGDLACNGIGFSDVHSKNIANKQSKELSKSTAKTRAIKNAIWQLERLKSATLNKTGVCELYVSNVSMASAIQNPIDNITYYFRESVTNSIDLVQRDVANPAKEILIGRYHIGPKSIKTIAILENSLPFSPLAAKSGWGHSWSNSVISGDHWTEKVIHLYEVIGLEPQTHERDGDRPFRYYASHAEKQLIALIVQQLALGRTGVKETLNCETLHILVSSKVCDDCKKFTNAIVIHFGFPIELHQFRRDRCGCPLARINKDVN